MSASAFVRAISIAGLICCFQPVAHAIPIGDFNWTAHSDEECLGGGFCGPLFSVGNFSGDVGLGGSFADVFVDLQTVLDPLSLSLGDEIAAGNSGQSFDDLSTLAVLFAGLRLTFAVPGLPGTVQLLDFDGNVVAGLTGPGSLLIDYAVRQVPTPVPEPSTLLLLAAALIGIAVARKTQQRNAQPKSRMKRSLGHVFAT